MRRQDKIDSNITLGFVLLAYCVNFEQLHGGRFRNMPGPLVIFQFMDLGGKFFLPRFEIMDF